VSEKLDELIGMARTIRMTPEQESHVSEGARHGAPAAQLCLWQHARSLDFARDDMSWEMIDRAAEELEKEK
jgi:hypothetical protein